MAEDFEEFEDSNKSRGINPLFVLGLVFFPALIVGSIFYGMFRYGKYKLSFISVIGLITSLITLIIGKIYLSQFYEITTIPAFIGIYIILCVLIGIWGGVLYVRSKLKDIERNPNFLEDQGLWTYELELKPTPWEKRSLNKKIEKLKNGDLIEEGKAPLGIDEDSPEKDIVYRYDSEAVKHTLIVGASGSGKTITMLSLMRKNILEHQPVVVIDLKRSAELASKLAKWTKESGGNFYHFVNGEPEDYDVKDSPGQVLYDPLSGGTPGTNADMLLGMREYEQASAHYKINMQQVLQVLFKMIFFGKKEIAIRLKRQKQAKKILETKPPKDPKKLSQLKKMTETDEILEKVLTNIDWNSGELYLIASVLRGANLSYLEKLVKDTEVGVDATEMMDLVRDKKDNQIKKSIQELQGQLRVITSSEYGKWLKTDKNKPSLNIFEKTKTPGNVILFSLNSDSEPEFAKFVGSIILSDITNVSAKRRNVGLENLVNIYVDEFQAVPPSAVTSLLEKSRASEMAMTLAQQSFDQIIASAPSNGKAYLGSILDTCSNFIIHAGSTEPSAQILAGIIGKGKKNKYVFSHATQNSRRRNKANEFQLKEEEDWKFPPSKFMELTLPTKENNYKATAIIINKGSSDPKYSNKKGAIARKTWMIPDSRVVEKYYIPTFKDNSNDEDEDTSEDFDYFYNEIEEDQNGEMTIRDNNSINSTIEDNDGGFGFEKINEDENTFEDLEMDEMIFTREEPIEEKTTADIFKNKNFKPQVREKPAKKQSKNNVKKAQEKENKKQEEISDFSLPDLLPDLEQ